MQKIPHRIVNLAEAVDKARVGEYDLRFHVLPPRQAAAAERREIRTVHNIPFEVNFVRALPRKEGAELFQIGRGERGGNVAHDAVPLFFERAETEIPESVHRPRVGHPNLPPDIRRVSLIVRRNQRRDQQPPLPARQTHREPCVEEAVFIADTDDVRHGVRRTDAQAARGRRAQTDGRAVSVVGKFPRAALRHCLGQQSVIQIGDEAAVFSLFRKRDLFHTPIV